MRPQPARPKRARCFARAAFTLATACALAWPAHTFAQGLISAGVGVGGGVGDRNKSALGTGAHGLGFLQLHPPLIPLALRVDALLAKTAVDGAGVSLFGNAVFIAPVPIVQPYALVGYGTYGIGKNGSTSGWDAGVGARLRIPLFSFFVEARRYQHARDMLTIGIVR
jgi:hypothetical protein